MPYTVEANEAAINAATRDMGDRLNGMADHAALTITLDPSVHPQVMRETLVHEVLHAITALTGIAHQLGDDEERLVVVMAPVVLAVLQEQPEAVGLPRGPAVRRHTTDDGNLAACYCSPQVESHENGDLFVHRATWEDHARASWWNLAAAAAHVGRCASHVGFAVWARWRERERARLLAQGRLVELAALETAEDPWPPVLRHHCPDDDGYEPWTDDDDE